MAADVGMSSESHSIYIQALYQQGSEGEILSKWYRIPDSELFSDVEKCSDLQSSDIHNSGPQCGEEGEKDDCGNFLDPIFNGPPNGLSSCASVASGSRIYVIGGVENSRRLNTDARYEFLTNRIYFRDIHNPDPDVSAWEEGPSMIKRRGGHCAAIFNDKIYVFGSSIRKWERESMKFEIWEEESRKYHQWPTFAECLELPVKSYSSPNTTPLWEALPEPYYKNDVSGYAILHHHKEIVLYCRKSNKMLIYDTVKKSWDYKPSAGCYHVVTCMDGILYGAEHLYWGSESIYAFDYKSEVGGFVINPEPEKHLLNLQGRVLPSGLIPVGQNVLCVLTGERITSESLFKICCYKYKISTTLRATITEICKINCVVNPGRFTVASQLLSRSIYYLPDVISVVGCLSVPPFEQMDDSKRFVMR